MIPFQQMFALSPACDFTAHVGRWHLGTRCTGQWQQQRKRPASSSRMAATAWQPEAGQQTAVAAPAAPAPAAVAAALQ